MTTVQWTQEQSEQYRALILKRMNKRPGMRETASEEELAFLERRHDQPLSLYSATWLSYEHDRHQLKECAFQQIRVCVGRDEPMSVAGIHRDFSPSAPWNDALPQATHELFSYIEENTEALLAEMTQLGLIDHIIAE